MVSHSYFPRLDRVKFQLLDMSKLAVFQIRGRFFVAESALLVIASTDAPIDIANIETVKIIFSRNKSPLLSW